SYVVISRYCCRYSPGYPGDCVITQLETVAGSLTNQSVAVYVSVIRPMQNTRLATIAAHTACATPALGVLVRQAAQAATTTVAISGVAKPNALHVGTVSMFKLPSGLIGELAPIMNTPITSPTVRPLPRDA